MSKTRAKKAERQAVDTRKPAQEGIEQRAYEIYITRGATDGHALEDWVQAEHELHENAVH